MGKTAVNQYNGPYSLSGDSGLSVGMVATTLMAGPEEDMMAEQTYHELLNQVRKYQLDSSGLTLFDANNNELLFFVFPYKG